MALQRRHNGWQSPHPPEQIAACIIYPIVTASYYVLFAMMLIDEAACWEVTWVHAGLMLTSLVTFILCETIDPIQRETNQRSKLCCLKHTKVASRYCSTCQKVVFGLDHHCTWLNTCIGINNYVPFVTLVGSNFFLFFIQAGVGATTLLVWMDEHDRAASRDNFRYDCVSSILVSVFTVLSGLLMLGFGALFSFHMYLIFIARMGTYDWILNGKQQSNASDWELSLSKTTQEIIMLEVKRQQERESWQKSRADSKEATEIISHKSSESILVSKTKVIPLPVVKENQGVPATVLSEHV